MDKLKRLPVKYVRDRAKSRYKKDSECYVCGVEEKLELHHPYTIDILFDKWIRKNNILINTVDDILEVRDDFIEQHNYEIYEFVFTLCNLHHKKLHKLYGQKPPLSTAEKQSRWLNKQRDKSREI